MSIYIKGVNISIIALMAGLILGQRIGIAIQRGNAARLLRIIPIDVDVDEFFDALLIVKKIEISFIF